VGHDAVDPIVGVDVLTQQADGHTGDREGVGGVDAQLNEHPVGPQASPACLPEKTPPQWNGGTAWIRRLCWARSRPVRPPTR
jgi:hypothetical protein